MSDTVREVNPQAAVPEKYVGPTGLASNITSQDLRLPRIALLQPLSPLVQNQSDKYKQGMFIDTLTENVFPEPITFVPAFIFKNVIKWKPRSEGGGILYKTLSPTPEQVEETRFHGDAKPSADMYINAVVLVEGQDIPFILSFCKTSLKAGHDLVTLASLSVCAWKYKYTLEATKVSNNKGTFYVSRVKRGALNENPLLAADLYEQVKGMSIETDYEAVSTDPLPDAGEPKEF